MRTRIICIAIAQNQATFTRAARWAPWRSIPAGHLIAATSTGGTCCKLPGRVGDSPLIGCGCYADAEAGGVSCTGWGEAIMKIVMAKTAVDLLRRESPQRTAQACVDLLASRTGGTGGLILLDREGTPAAAFNTPNMAWGSVQPDGSFFVTV